MTYIRKSQRESKKKTFAIKLTNWKERAAEAIAREIIAKGHFEKSDFNGLEAKILRMLNEYQTKWG